MLNNDVLEKLAVEARKRTIEVIYSAGRGHMGGSLSSIDILVNLYFSVLNIDPYDFHKQERDRFILSKGHSVEAYYVVLAMRGFINDNLLKKYGNFNSPLAGHPINKIPGIEINSGSLGHGLSVGVGMAIAAKNDDLPYKVFVLMGDGEHGEGSIMEAVTAASHYKLDNLIAIVDKNKFQLTGPTEEVMAIGDLAKKYESYGWSVLTCNGNKMSDLSNTFSSLPYRKDMPTVIIANTIKGKGVSFMENQAKWHHKVPDKQELTIAMLELENKIKELSHAIK